MSVPLCRTWRPTSFNSRLDNASIAVLCELLGIDSGNFPACEGDDEAIQFLKQFAQHVDTRTKLANTEIQQNRELKNDYQIEEERLQEQLRLIGITKDALSKESRENVDFISRVADTLQLLQPKLNHIACKWTDAYLQKLSVDVMKRELESVISKSREMSQRLEQSKNKIEAEIEACARPMSYELPLPPNPTEKIEQYRRDVQQCKSALEQAGFTSELTHSAISTRVTKWNEHREQVAALKKDLAQYDPDLPKDMEEARAKFVEMEKELEAVSERIRTKIISDGWMGAQQLGSIGGDRIQ